MLIENQVGFCDQHSPHYGHLKKDAPFTLTNRHI